jgi:hypothetical protein
MAAYLNREREKLDRFIQENETGRRDEEIMDGDEPIVLDNPVFKAFEHDPDAFFTLCGFEAERFRQLFGLVERALTVPKRGRMHVMGPMDGFFLFLHWLRSANLIDGIAVQFQLRSPTLYKHRHQVEQLIHQPLVNEFIKSQWNSPIQGSSTNFPACGLVVDATVQKVGRPRASFTEARRFFSGKQWIYCLKSQVITDRREIAMHFFAGGERSVHNLEVFRRTLNHLYKLLEDHPNEPTKILADKGYIGFNGSSLVKLVTPHKKLPHGFLSVAQVRSNQRLSSARVVVEN